MCDISDAHKLSHKFVSATNLWAQPQAHMFFHCCYGDTKKVWPNRRIGFFFVDVFFVYEFARTKEKKSKVALCAFSYKWQDPFICVTSLIHTCYSRSHVWMSHVTHMNESYHTDEWVMSHISCNSFIRVWLIHTCLTHSYVFHSFIRVINELFIVMSHISCNSYEWLSHTCDLTPIHMCDMTQSYHTDEWVMSHISCNSFIRVWLIHTCDQWVIHSHVTHMNESCHTDEW